MKTFRTIALVAAAAMTITSMNVIAAPAEAPADGISVTWLDSVLNTEITGALVVDPAEETWALSYETQYGPDCLQGDYTVVDGAYDSVLTDGGNAGEFAELAFQGIKPVLDSD